MLHLQFTLQSQELTALFRRQQFQTTRWRWVLLSVLMILVAWICFQIGGWRGLLMFVIIFSVLLIWLLWGYPSLVLRTMKKMPSWGNPPAVRDVRQKRKRDKKICCSGFKIPNPMAADLQSASITLE